MSVATVTSSKSRFAIQRFCGWLSTFQALQLCTCAPPVVVRSSCKTKMPRPYSVDFRWRIIWLTFVQKKSPASVSRQLCVSVKSVKRHQKLFWLTGDVAPKIQRHRPQLLLGDFEQLTLLRLIAENPRIYLSELQDKLFNIVGVLVSVPTICKTLKVMGCCRRVISYVAKQRSDELQARFMAEMSAYEVEMCIFLDESSCDKRCGIRRYAYIYYQRGTP